MLIFAPLLVLGLVLFLRRSRFGLGIRSSAANPEAARMAGIFSGRMAAMAWAIAGGVSAFTAILTAPSRGFVSGESFGPALLLRALAGAVIARMTSLPRALAAGIGIGIVEQILLWNSPRAGVVEIALFVIILIALLVQRREAGREEEKGSWAAVQAWRPVPEALNRVWLIRNLGRVIAGVALIAALLLPLVISHSNSITMVSIYTFALVGLSVGILTGLGGQLTLGQFAVAAVGATVSFVVASRVSSFGLSFLYAGLAGGAVSLLIGLPALRLRGLMLTVTTLGFALVVPAWLLQQEWMLGDGVDPGRPTLFGNLLDSGKEYYFFALGVLLLTLWLARNVRRGGFSRMLVAIRDNEDNARAFTIRARLVKMQAYVLAGFVAGVGGATYGHALSIIGTTSFPTGSSVDIAMLTVVGGMAILAGPLLGALVVIGVPAFLPLDSAGLAGTKLGLLLLILYAPGGVAQLLQPVRNRLISWLARRHGIDAEAAEAAETADPDREGDAPEAFGRAITSDRAARTVELRREGAPDPGVPEGLRSTNGHRPRTGDVQLEGVDLRKWFGGVRAVDGVTIRVNHGETVGLIGPNGAGKTTLFELLGGFTKADAGRVVFEREDVSALGPEGRGRLGLIRSFQDAALFPTMTVQESVMLALERTEPTSLLASITGLMGAERRKERQARELIAFMGLDVYRNRQIQELSTGTRRITELACLIALQPTLLLLDEPSSGIAQRETEALGGLLQTLKREIDTSLLVIEHDIPLIMGISDRIVAMDAGVVIAQGTPEEIRTDPLVVEAYLGGSLDALERSNGGRKRVAKPRARSRR
jgi:ABC-type branched-subunit amino acid transport system ATPase component/ABC-type branched-subunit amino acid transport system permease subunit